MIMEKQAFINLNVDTSSKKIQTKVQFSSLDVGSAKLIFSITKDGVPLPLSAVIGELDLSMADGSTFNALSVKITDVAKGIMEYSLTKDQLKHTGMVEAQLSVKYDDGQSMSISKFEFKIDKALRDQNIAVKSQHYIKDFEDLKQVVNERASQLNVDIDTLTAEINSKFTELEALAELVEGFDSNVAQATVVQVNAAKTNSKNKTYTDLKTRLDYIEDGDIDCGTF